MERLTKESWSKLPEHKKAGSISLTYFYEVAGKNKVLMRELMEMFIARLPKEINEVKNWAKAEDWGKLEKALHQISPSFRYVEIESAEKLIESLRVMINSEEIEADTIHKSILKLEVMSEKAVNQAIKSLQFIWWVNFTEGGNSFCLSKSPVIPKVKETG